MRREIKKTFFSPRINSWVKIKKHKFFWLAAIAVFVACNGKIQRQHTPNEQILSVEIYQCGGDMGAFEKYIFTKDSIHYYAGTYGKTDKERHFATPNSFWNEVLNRCNVDEFAKIPNGKSYSAFDGSDTEITIETNKRVISVLNGDGEEFDKIKNLILEINSWAKMRTIKIKIKNYET